MAAPNKDLLEWLLEHKGIVVVVLVFVAQFVRGLFRTRRTLPTPDAKPDELEAERRTREIREQIQRQRAERRGESTGTEQPARSEPAPPPVPRPIETTQMPEPFGGALRRVLQELQGDVQPPPMPVPPPLAVEQRDAELARQEQLAEQMRVLEESRMLARRRVTELAATNYAESQSEGGLRTVTRGKLLEDLRDPASLRRAFLLREVLGPPVGMR